jgi:hypothetical protein
MKGRECPHEPNVDHALDDNLRDLFSRTTGMKGPGNMELKMSRPVSKRREVGNGEKFLALGFEGRPGVDSTEGKFHEIIREVRGKLFQFFDEGWSVFGINPADLF